MKNNRYTLQVTRYTLKDKSKILVLLFFLFSVFCFPFSVFRFLSSSVSAEEVPFNKGETISYRIYWKGIRIGSAKLVFGDEIILQTNTLNFKDVEKIKGDEDYFPVEVKRDIRLFGKTIQILEKYDQKKKTIEIVREKSGKIEKQLIESDDKIHHPILLIYYCRKQELVLGKSWLINLPLAGKYRMEVTKLEEIKTPAGKYQAYCVESFPAKIKFWISADKKHLPLKIEKDDSYFTRSSLVMTNFSGGTE
ncbi:MAG: DUF3108 domain-containing protein [Candidatus Omnitrophica bacterium]|nr:DUF3108 domain-containing protein [Candidatus Omnitrophota bacterium]